MGGPGGGAVDAARGQGYLLQTISSAALITGPSGPGYTMTKHGALGFAEWLALNYGHRGIRVSCLCPNAVYTGMFGRLRTTSPPLRRTAARSVRYSCRKTSRAP